MDLEYSFNLCEAALWSAFGVVMLAKTRSAKTSASRRIYASLSAAFFLFGVSDFIEAHTGAWWTPWWLLVWKAACVVWLALGFFRYYKTNQTKPANAA